MVFKCNDTTRLPVNIHECLRSVTDALRLTRWGQIKFLSFSEDILQEAFKEYKELSFRPQNQFEYLFSLCIRICEERKIAPNWELMTKLAQEFNMKPGDPMVLPPPKVIRSKNRNKRSINTKQEYYHFEEIRPKLPKEYQKMKNPYEMDMVFQKELPLDSEPPQNIKKDIECKKTNQDLPVSTILKGTL